MLQLRNCIAHGAGVSGGVGCISTHANDAIESLKTNHFVRLLKNGSKALQHAGCHRQIANHVSLKLDIATREADDAGPGQLEQLWMDAAQRAPCADKRHIALGNKITDGLRDRFIGIRGEVSLILGELLCHSRVLPGERAVDVEEADVAVLFCDSSGGGGWGGGDKARFEPHDSIKVFFDTGNGDANDYLSRFAGDDEAPGARCDEGCVVCDNGRVCDLNAQARGAIGRSYNIANATQERNDLLSKQMILG